jgi:hypothetical protein
MADFAERARMPEGWSVVGEGDKDAARVVVRVRGMSAALAPSEALGLAAALRAQGLAAFEAYVSAKARAKVQARAGRWRE